MKRVLMTVFVVQLGMFLVGCEKRTEEPSGTDSGDTSGPAATKPTAVEEEEPAKPDPNRGLVGWWKFDETLGKTAVDSSQSGQDGTLKGGLSFDSNSVAGRVGKALKFEGGDDYVEIAGYKGIVGTRPRTVTAWIKTSSSDGEIMSWGQDEGGRMFIFGFVRGRIGVTPQGGYLYMNAQTHDDRWHHVAVAVEETELPNLHDHAKVFLDGDVAEIHNIGILDLWPIDTGSDLDVTIGKDFQGIIDDVRLYDRALSWEEIRLLFVGQ